MKRFLFSISIGIIAFIIVFVINWKVNLIQTALFRGLIAFFVFIAIGYISNFIILSFNSKQVNDLDAIDNNKEIEDSKENLLKDSFSEESQSFQPLKLDRVENDEQILNGVRRLLNSD